MRFLRQCCGAGFFFGPPIFFIAVAFAVVSLQSLFGPVDSENCDRAQLVPLMQFRDFRKFSPSLVARLANRYDAEFGRRSGKMPEFRFTDAEKKIYAHFGGSESSDTRFETNLNLMAKAKYFEWMELFESQPRSRQPILMNEIIADMKWWEELYMNFLRAAELPIPTAVELMQQFDDMIESFKIGADDADIVRIDRFKRQMITGFVGKVLFGGLPGM